MGLWREGLSKEAWSPSIQPSSPSMRILHDPYTISVCGVLTIAHMFDATSGKPKVESCLPLCGLDTMQPHEDPSGPSASPVKILLVSYHEAQRKTLKSQTTEQKSVVPEPFLITTTVLAAETD